MFKDTLATVLELAGILAVCVAIFLVSPVLALGAAGVSDAGSARDTVARSHAQPTDVLPHDAAVSRRAHHAVR